MPNNPKREKLASTIFDLPEPAAVWVDLSELTPWQDNPRHNDQAVESVAQSIERFGFGAPILARREDGEVIAGHTRLKAAQSLGLEKVPVRYLNLDPADARLLALADNRLGELADWDEIKLAGILEELRAEEADLELLGWDDEDIDKIIDGATDDPYADGQPGSMQARFGVPPFSVLDTRQGYWMERRREWLALGLDSGQGRGEALLASASAEIWQGSKTSVFDPVLCEMVVQWFSNKGHTVLDPFAGGSVRGVVAAKVGRDYVGVDLRPEQVSANQSQWEAIQQATPAAPNPEKTTSDPNAITPIQKAGDVWLKRDDLFVVNNANGGKVRTIMRLAKGSKGVVTCGARQSTMLSRAALVAEHLGIGCRLHTAQGKDTQGIKTSIAAGAKVLRHKAGYLSVIKKRAKDDAAESGWALVPWAGESKENIDQASEQVPDKLPEGVERIVVCVGSGMTLAGVLWGLKKRKIDCPVLGVLVGSDPRERLNHWAPKGWKNKVELVESKYDYDKEVKATVGGVLLDPVYEAKCAEHLKPGDLLWIVGMRSTDKPMQDSGSAEWIAGDSKDIQDLAKGTEADLVFSCPPYADLEVYSDDPRDISNMDYDGFLSAYREIIAKSCEMLKPDRFACFVVGEVRGKDGAYRNFIGDTVQAFLDAGLHYYNEMVLINSAGSLPLRAGRVFDAGRKVGKMHQNVLVFYKGDLTAIGQNFEAVDITVETDADFDATE